MQTPNKPAPVKFTRQQVEFLERNYPENTALLPTDQMIYRQGQRSVLADIRGRMAKDGES